MMVVSYYYLFNIIVSGIVESKVNGSQTVLKSMQNKRIQKKGPFMANVPVQHMVQNYKNVENKDVIHGSVNSRKVCLYEKYIF